MTSIVTGTIGLCVAALILLLIRKDRLHVQQGLGWVVVAIGFALLGFSPRVIDWMASQLGIANPPVLALVLGLVVLVIKTLLMDLQRSRLELRSQRLVQRVAMLEAELRQLKHSLERDAGRNS
jgi:hypothetical protein